MADRNRDGEKNFIMTESGGQSHHRKRSPSLYTREAQNGAGRMKNAGGYGIRPYSVEGASPFPTEDREQSAKDNVQRTKYREYTHFTLFYALLGGGRTEFALTEKRR